MTEEGEDAEYGMYGMDGGMEEEEGDYDAEETRAERRQQYERFYEQFDKDKSGQLSLKELRLGLQVIGLNPTLAQTKELLKKFDVSAKKLSFEDFEKILDSFAVDGFDIMAAFRQFDKDGSGTLDARELRVCLRSLGEQMTDEEIDDLFAMLDSNNDGKLSYMEFTKLFA